MKKFSSIGLALLLILTMFSSTAFASSNSKSTKLKLVKHNDPITDVDKLMERVKNKVSDIKETNIEKIKIKDLKTGKESTSDPLVTTQLINSYENDTATETVNEYMTAYIVTSAAITQQHYAEKWDSSGGAVAYSYIYWSETTSGSYSYAKITTVTGGYTNHDSHLLLFSPKVTVGQFGKDMSNNTIGESRNYYPSGIGSGYTYDVSSWSDYIRMISADTVGATSYCVVQNAGTGAEWSITCTNNVPMY